VTDRAAVCNPAGGCRLPSHEAHLESARGQAIERAGERPRFAAEAAPAPVSGRTLVAGASGAVGTPIGELLAEEGTPLRALVRSSTRPEAIARDVARVAVWTLRARETVNATLDLGGPEALSYEEVIAVFEEHTRRPLSRSHVPLAELERPYADATDGRERSLAGVMLSVANGAHDRHRRPHRRQRDRADERARLRRGADRRRAMNPPRPLALGVLTCYMSAP
jgi:hypothetical protein